MLQKGAKNLKSFFPLALQSAEDGVCDELPASDRPKASMFLLRATISKHYCFSPDKLL
jgi:hypothetical protein